MDQAFLPLLVSTALVDSLNPCAFSVLFLTLAFIFSLGGTRLRAWKVGGVYIFGIFLVYTLIGIGLLQVMQIFDVPRFVSKIGAVIIIIAGALSLIGLAWPKFPIRLKIPEASHGSIAKLIHEASLPAAFLLGLLVGMSEFPCTGGPYLTAIGLLHDQATFWSGLGFLILYNLIFILPLLIILLAVTNKLVLDKLETWKKTNLTNLKIVTSLLMILIGALILII